MAQVKKFVAEYRPLSATVTEQQSRGNSDDVVAAIAGAVAFICGENATISSIKPRRTTGAGRSAWNMAGLLENTRPF